MDYNSSDLFNITKIKTYLYHATQLMIIALFANFVVEFLTEGTITALLEKPLHLLNRFFQSLPVSIGGQ